MAIHEDKTSQKNPSVSITTKSPTHIDAPTVGDTQTPSNLGEFGCITLLGLVNVRVGLHASARVHYNLAAPQPPFLAHANR